MKALPLLKQNIEALLRARHQEQKDLAQWCRRTEQWLSAALTQEERGIPVKYLDRIADFFGIATYQLFQPGIAPLTERRKRTRRSGADRRVSMAHRGVQESVSQMVEALTPHDMSTLLRIRSLSEAERAEVEKSLSALPLSRTRGPKTARKRGGTVSFVAPSQKAQRSPPE